MAVMPCHTAPWRALAGRWSIMTHYPTITGIKKLCKQRKMKASKEDTLYTFHLGQRKPGVHYGREARLQNWGPNTLFSYCPIMRTLTPGGIVSLVVSILSLDFVNSHIGACRPALTQWR